MSVVLSRANLLRASTPRVERGSYWVQTWGCQMNDEDSEQLGLNLQNAGFRPAASILEAQIVLLNTCSVRRKPEDKAFSLLGELALAKKGRPELIIGVCGCMAQIRADEIKKRAPHVDFVLGTGDLSQVVGLVEEAAQSRRFAKRLELPARKGAVVTDLPQRKLGRDAKLKAFVPIQYGCDKFCAFCIVPSTRGRERSRPSADIVTEVRGLVGQGTQEITLLGQTVNSYGKNLAGGKLPFSKLLWELAEIEGLKRIRYTSPYPRDFRADLIETIRDCPAVMEHCHLPLQSGDDQVLVDMKRLYDVAGFRKIVAELRAAYPRMGLTTDIIVGFPTETEEQFQHTLDLVNEIEFDGAYMFIYSPRPGTPAADMLQLPMHVRKSRMDRLVELQNAITVKRRQAMVGQEFEVLVEGPSPKDPSRLQGYTREFHMTHFEGPPELIGKLVKVRATEGRLWGFAAEWVPCS